MKYDQKNHITTKTITEQDITKEQRYEYDKLGRLVKKIKEDGEIVEYQYDKNGNITNKTIIINGEITSKETYGYDETIPNRLIGIYNPVSQKIIQQITYDENNDFYPSSIMINGKFCDLSWEGKTLKQIGNNIYTYNANGIRIKKETANETTTYELSGTSIIQMHKITSTENVTLEFIYDEKGLLGGIVTNEGNYFYVRDITGNIIGLIDSNGEYIVKYTYDAWGNLLNKDITISSIASRHNPFMYKGYYYDEETKFYYLLSRYYVPEIGRFLSPDSIDYLEPERINGLNLYTYCYNNPIIYKDSSGTIPEWATFSNLFEASHTAFQLILNGAFIGGYYNVANAVRPNNIGVGIWNKQRASAIEGFSDDAKSFNKFGNILSALTIAIQVGEGIFNDISRGYTVDRIISNAIFNTAVYSLTTIGLAKFGGFAGTLIPIPIVGTAVGTAVGYLAGLGINLFLEIEINGKTAIDHARDFVYDVWKSIFD